MRAWDPWYLHCKTAVREAHSRTGQAEDPGARRQKADNRHSHKQGGSGPGAHLLAHAHRGRPHRPATTYAPRSDLKLAAMIRLTHGGTLTLTNSSFHAAAPYKRGGGCAARGGRV